MNGSEIDFDPREDYYKILGVEPSATAAEIKKAYRRLAKANHPDATGGNRAKEARFKDISRAYDVLGNQERRARYDLIRRGGGRAPQFDFGTAPGGGVDLGTLFSQVFGAGAVPNSNVEYRVYGGGDPEVFGGGFFEGSPGWSARSARSARPRPPMEKTVRAADGSPLRSKGADIYSDLRLGFDEACLGASKTISTLSGTATVKVPPGTSSGKKLRLRGQGQLRSDGSYGDHYAVIQIDVPAQMSKESKKALAKLMKALAK